MKKLRDQHLLNLYYAKCVEHSGVMHDPGSITKIN